MAQIHKFSSAGKMAVDATKKVSSDDGSNVMLVHDGAMVSADAPMKKPSHEISDYFLSLANPPRTAAAIVMI